MESPSTDSKFHFWQQWLFYSSLLFAFAGICFSLFQGAVIFDPYERMIARIFWNRDEFPSITTEYQKFVCGIFGATFACCYLLLAFISYFPFREGRTWARNAVLISFGTWAILDTAICLHHGVYFQGILVNALSILVKALPLIFTWRFFSRSQPSQ